MGKVCDARNPQNGTNKVDPEGGKNTHFRPGPKPGCWTIILSTFPFIFRFYTINEADKWFSLPDTILNCVFFGHPGEHLHLSF